MATDALPLAARMRPKTLDDVVGQEHILAPDKLLYRSIRADRLGSIILYGPPGTGKTSIAMVIANETKARFTQLNATTSGKKDMETAVKAAQTAQEHGRKTILFVDEIHRFNNALRGIRPDYAHRRDHGKPVLRSQQGPDFPLPRI